MPAAMLNSADSNELAGRELRVHTLRQSAAIVSPAPMKALTDNRATSSLTPNPIFGLTDGWNLKSLNWQSFVSSKDKLIHQ